MTRLGLGLIMALWISLWQDIVALWNNLWQDFSLVLSWSCELGLGLIMALFETPVTRLELVFVMVLCTWTGLEHCPVWNTCDKTWACFCHGPVYLDWAWPLPCETPVTRLQLDFIMILWNNLWQDLDWAWSWPCETPVTVLGLGLITVLWTNLWQDFSLFLSWFCEADCD